MRSPIHFTYHDGDVSTSLPVDVPATTLRQVMEMLCISEGLPAHLFTQDEHDVMAWAERLVRAAADRRSLTTLGSPVKFNSDDIYMACVKLARIVANLVTDLDSTRHAGVRAPGFVPSAFNGPLGAA